MADTRLAQGQDSNQHSDHPELPLTRPDNRNIRFSVDPREVNLGQLITLFQRNAFWAQTRTEADMAKAVAASHPVVTVWDGERQMGFARATSDGVFRAVIWDVVIDQDYRNQGLGRKLVETLISHPDLMAVERVYLFTTHQKHFYERIGFSENATTTMVLQGRSLEFVIPPA